MIPLWCTEDINSHIAEKPLRLFSITHNDAGIPLQNRRTEDQGKRGSEERERTIRERVLDKNVETGSAHLEDWTD